MRHAAKFMPPAPQRRYETKTNGLNQRFPKAGGCGENLSAENKSTTDGHR
jgi:hypothetical protein